MLGSVGILNHQRVQLPQINAKTKLTILFPNQQNCTGQRNIGWSYSSNINHFLEVLPGLIIQPWQHSPIVFLNRPSPLLQGNLMLHDGGSSHVQVVLGNDFHIFSQNVSCFPMALWVPLNTPQKLTLSRTSDSRAGTSQLLVHCLWWFWEGFEQTS